MRALITDITEKTGRPPEEVCLAGNTVMEHLLLGLDVSGLGSYPFRPVSLEEQRLELFSPDVPRADAAVPSFIRLLPGISAFVGADILAAATGTVVTAGWVSGYGNYTVIDHGGGMMTAYGHQSQILVSVGQTVQQGELIGKVGSTGNSTGPHLHFEVYINGETVDPKSFF